MLMDAPRAPRICMPTFAPFARHLFRTSLYEAQAVLAACDDVDVMPLEASARLALGESVLRRLVYHDVSRRLVSLNPGLRRVRLTKEYDVFILVCGFLPDVWYANAVAGWRDQCRTSICWIDELWASDLPQLEYWLPALSRFDYVIVKTGGSGKALGDALGRPPCHEIQGGVDALRFSPFPDPPARVVDVYSIGRRWEGIHRALLESRDIFYLHDTVKSASESETADHAQHRDLYAGIAKRTRFFLVAPGKMNSPRETQGQVALGHRYFEGSAAGAVLLGQRPACEAFRRYFDIPNAVIEIQPDGSDAVEVIAKLSAHPETLREISCRNAENSLRSHDWVYRWKDILGLAGLRPTPAMHAREQRLRELADLAAEAAR